MELRSALILPSKVMPTPFSVMVRAPALRVTEDAGIQTGV